MKVRLNMYFLIFSTLPVLILSAGRSNFMENIELCRMETNATRAEVFNTRRHEIPATKTEECLLACIQKKNDFMHEDNTIDLDNLIESIEHIKNFDEERYNNLKNIYEDCKSSEITVEDECEAAKNWAECVFPKERELGPPPGPRGHHGGPRGPPRPFPRGQSMCQFPRAPPDVAECKNKTGATMGEIRDILRHVIPKTSSGQCMLACTLKKWSFINEDNKIDLEKIKARFDDMKEHNPYIYNRTIEIHTECQKNEKEESDECLAAQNYAECVFPKVQLSQLPPVFRRNIEECSLKTGATDAEVYSSVIRKDVPKTDGEACVLACMQKKIGTMNDDNTIEINEMKQQFRHLRFRNEDLYNKLIEKMDYCKNEELTENDECVAARKFSECFTLEYLKIAF